MALSGLMLAFLLLLVPSRHARRSSRYRYETEGVLAFEQACCACRCLMGNGLWAK